MLRTTDSLKGYAIHATDGEVGSVLDVYFDDERWGVRYLIVETGSWLSKRAVLISPYSISGTNDAEKAISVTLTREQVKNSPDIDTHKPVSRQLEGDYSRYYGYSLYWSGPYLWGAGTYPMLPTDEAAQADRGAADAPLGQEQIKPEDVHLRSASEVSGYHILGTDDDIGHVKDFIFDDESWALRYLLVDTHNWWPGGKKVLIGTQWIDRIDWPDSAVQTKLTREQIRNSPEYNETQPLDRDYETRLHQFYGRTGYWE